MLAHFQTLEEYYLTINPKLFLKVENLSKFYGKKEVVNLNFGLNEGICLGIIGPNGAGKTTTLNLLLSLVQKDDGNLEINFEGNDDEDKQLPLNDDIYTNAEYIPIQNKSVKKNFWNENCGICFQEDSLWNELTVSDHLQFFMELFNVQDNNHIKRLMRYFEIEYLIDREVYKLSTGERKKLLMILNLINYTKYFFLDETSANLDPDSREDLRKVLNKLKMSYKCTIITTTHYVKGNL